MLLSIYSQLYWLTRLDGLIIFSAIGIFICLMIIVMSYASSAKSKLLNGICITIGTICMLILLFVPSKKDMIFIIAGGKTVEFIQNDTSAVKIPGQVTKVISQSLDELEFMLKK